MERSYSIPVLTQDEFERQASLGPGHAPWAVTDRCGAAGGSFSTALRLWEHSGSALCCESGDGTPRSISSAAHDTDASSLRWRLSPMPALTPSYDDDPESASDASRATSRASRRHSSWPAPPRPADGAEPLRPGSTKPLGGELVIAPPAAAPKEAAPWLHAMSAVHSVLAPAPSYPDTPAWGAPAWLADVHSDHM